MNHSLTIILAFAAGICGALLTRFIAPTPALAQAPKAVVQEIRARNFVLVDGQDRVVGKFTYVPDPNPPFGTPRRSRIVLLDPTGQEIWSVGANKFRPLTER